MGKIRTIDLSEAQLQELEQGYRSGERHAFRQRCQLVLLKSEGRTSQQVGQFLKLHPVTVNSWLSRYQAEGIGTYNGSRRFDNHIGYLVHRLKTGLYKMFAYKGWVSELLITKPVKYLL